MYLVYIVTMLIDNKFHCRDLMYFSNNEDQLLHVDVKSTSSMYVS